ncbi:MAG: hypothetical protein WBW88_19255, partial [Rhodothermales bacterium]
ALTVFFMSGLVAKSMILIKVTGADGERTSLYGAIYHAIFAPLASPKNSSLMFAIAWVLVWYLVLHVMYKRGIIVKV